MKTGDVRSRRSRSCFVAGEGLVPSCGTDIASMQITNSRGAETGAIDKYDYENTAPIAIQLPGSWDC